MANSCITLTGKNLQLAGEVANELGYKLGFVGAKLNSWIDEHGHTEAPEDLKLGTLEKPILGKKAEDFKTYDLDGNNLDRNGYPLTYSEYPNAKFYVSKSVGGWRVYNSIEGTGKTLGNNENTRKEAIDNFHTLINEKSKELKNLNILQTTGLFIPKETGNKESVKEGEYRLPSKQELIDHIKSTTGDYISRTFVHNINEVSDMEKVHKAYDPQTKSDRTALIATLFTKIVNREQAKKENQILTREQVINKLTPKGIFNEIKDTFIKSQEVEGVSEKRIAEFKKVVDNFDALCKLSTTNLKVTEGLKFNFDDSKIVKKVDMTDDVNDEGNEKPNSNDPGFKEDQIKDGWMVNFRHLSVNESLSQNVRRVLAGLVKIGYDGEPEQDDLRFERHIDPDHASGVLMTKLSGMTKSKHLIPMLEALATNHPWVYNILDQITPEEGVKISKAQRDLQSQFYSNYRKDFVPMWIQTSKLNKAGRVTYTTSPLNYANGISHLMESARDNYESGTKLTENSIYDEGGKLIQANANNNLVKVIDLDTSYKELKLDNNDTVENHNLIISKWVSDNIITLQDLAKSIGIDVDTDTLDQALTYKLYAGTKELTYESNITEYMDKLRSIFVNIKPGDKDEEGNEGRVDLADQKKAYASLTNIISKVTEQDMESSFNEDSKSFYSHLVPSYIGKLMKNFQIAHGDMGDFKEFLAKEFDQYNWFKGADGKYRLEWLRELTASGQKGIDNRALFERKSVLHFDKVYYPDLTDKQYTIELLNEYFADPKHRTAYYHVPILADAPSAEFIKFKKYINGATTPGGDYKEFLLDRFVESAHQELDRITEVNKRKPLIANGTVKAIDNIDTNGNKFYFFPKLNDRLKEIQDLASSNEPLAGKQIDGIIRDTIKQSMDESFNERLKDWDRTGLFNTDKDVNNEDTHILTTLRVPSSMRLSRGSEELGDIQGAVRADMENYYWNSFFATSQIIQLTTTDLAYYKGIEDFQKRNKQIYAPATRLNTSSQYGREIERTAYLKDNMIISKHLKDLEVILDAKLAIKDGKKGSITPLEKAKIMATYGAANQWTRQEEVLTASGESKKTKTVQIDEAEYNQIKNDKTQKAQKFYAVTIDGKTYKAVSQEINETDAQAYRSLSSRRAVTDMAGNWTPQMEKTFNNFQKGKWDMGDFDTVWNAEKPFYYGQSSVDTGVDGKMWKVPVQNKNSETLLLMLGAMGASPELSALNEFMEKNNIDVVQFESAVKEGGQGKIDINNLNDKASILQKLNDSIIDPSTGQPMPDVIHELNYEDYGIQNTVPEHLMDAESLYGTQFRREIMADLPSDDPSSPDHDPNFRLTVKDADGTERKFTKKEALDLYNQLHVDNLIDSFNSVKTTFGSNEEVSKRLLEEVRGSKRFGLDMIRAVTLNNKKEFVIPVNEPSQTLRIQSLLNSIIRSEITKQKMNGGSAIQVSNFGLSDDLNIVFEGEGANKRIKHFEVYMPWYSRKYFQPLIDPNTGLLDMNRLPEGRAGEELRELIGYRIPTEDKYSMAPLFIKGFLPQQLGGAIMLPSEITTISGSDFDIDKLYLMIPNFKITNKNAENTTLNYLVKDFAKTHPKATEEQKISLRDEMQTIFKQIIDGEEFTPNSKEDVVNKYLMANKSQFRLEPSIEKIHYDHEIGSQNNTREQRDNMLQDLSRAVLTHPDTASKILNPGGFDALKSAARITTLLDNVPLAKLKEMAESNGFGKDNYYNYLRSLTLEESSALAEQFKPQLNMLDPRSQVILHQRNMNAAKLIGMAANQVTSHAMIQHTKLELTKDFDYINNEGEKKTVNGGEFRLNGIKASSLHSVRAFTGEFISRLLAINVGASVDAVKDPVLSDVNMNTFTFDVAGFLNRCGYDHNTVSLFLQQPIIRKLTTEYFNRSKDGDRKEDIINEVIKEYSKSEDPSITERYKNQKFMNADLAGSIAVSREAEAMTEDDRSHSSDAHIKSYYNDQVNAAYLFKHLMANADLMSDMINATKADTSNGSVGPSNADTIDKMSKVEDYLNAVTPDSEKVPIEKRKRILFNNAHIISNDSISEDGYNNARNEHNLQDEQAGTPMEQRTDLSQNDYIRQTLLNSPSPMVQGFYTLGLKSSEDMMGRMFPEFNPEFRDVIDQMKGFTKGGRLDVRTINNIQNDLYAYIMSGRRFLGGTNEEMRGKRDAFINHFIPEYNKIIQNNPEMAKLDIIKALEVKKATDGNVNTLISRTIGGISQAKKEAITNSWTTLFYMGEEGQQLAMNLFQYAYYRNGFAFSNNSFMHLAPSIIKEAAPEYLDTLRELVAQKISPEEAKGFYQHFLLQYLRNHPDNRRMVPNIDAMNSKAGFLDTKNELNKSVTITIDKDSTADDKKFVSKNTTQEIAWRPLITVNYKGGEELYVNDDYLDDSDKGRTTATYTRIDRLGMKNNFLEYEFDTPHNNVTSVIDNSEIQSSDPAALARLEAKSLPQEDHADYEEYIKNNPDREAPKDFYDINKYEDASKEALKRQFPDAKPEDIKDETQGNANTDARDYFYSEEYKKRMEEDNNC